MISAVKGATAITAAQADRLRAAYQDAVNAERQAQEAAVQEVRSALAARRAAAIVADGQEVASIYENGRVAYGDGGYEAAIAWMTLGGLSAEQVATRISNMIGTSAVAVKLR